MQILKEEKIKYKQGMRYENDDVVIRIRRDGRQYRVEGYRKDNLDMFYSPYYASLKGVKNYLVKNFGIELEE